MKSPHIRSRTMYKLVLPCLLFAACGIEAPQPTDTPRPGAGGKADDPTTVVVAPDDLEVTVTTEGCGPSGHDINEEHIGIMVNLDGPVSERPESGTAKSFVCTVTADFRAAPGWRIKRLSTWAVGWGLRDEGAAPLAVDMSTRIDGDPVGTARHSVSEDDEGADLELGVDRTGALSPCDGTAPVLVTVSSAPAAGDGYAFLVIDAIDIDTAWERCPVDE